MTTVPVSAGDPYDVHIGDGVLRELVGVVSALGGVQRVALLYPDPVAALARDTAGQLERSGLDVSLLSLPDGEAAKTTQSLHQAWSALGEAGFTRSDLVVGLGGGATTDLAGFVAATWLRGVRFVSVPTTLLGMVDAAVGGKTGINTQQGKNLVGAFHEPAAVLCDLGVLRSLPQPEYLAGMAEVVKCGFVADPVILDLVEADPRRAAAFDPELASTFVERSVQVKAEVIAGDLRETSGSAGGEIGREALNYGHTLGHAIERREDFRWRHGHAVSVGLVFAGALGHAAGLIDADLADRHRSTLNALGLPVSYPADAFADLRVGMQLDKKTRGTTLRFVVLSALAEPALLVGPEESVLREAWEAVAV
jgi:3-dehydroquinate synthase